MPNVSLYYAFLCGALLWVSGCGDSGKTEAKNFGPMVDGVFMDVIATAPGNPERQILVSYPRDVNQLSQRTCMIKEIPLQVILPPNEINADGRPIYTVTVIDRFERKNRFPGVTYIAGEPTVELAHGAEYRVLLRTRKVPSPPASSQKRVVQ